MFFLAKNRKTHNSDLDFWNDKTKHSPYPNPARPRTLNLNTTFSDGVFPGFSKSHGPPWVLWRKTTWPIHYVVTHELPIMRHTVNRPFTSSLRH